jgi:hypothetical protein
MSSQPVPVESRAVASPPVTAPELPAAQTQVCANCGAPLGGEFCAACGQRHEPHVHTLAHFAGEAFESVTHADSRLWRTIGYLLVKPGHLTREFFAGRRASYLPPFRLYLVISLLFFLVAGLPDRVDIEDEGPPTPESIASLKAGAATLEKNAANTPGMAAVADAMRKKAAEQEAILSGASPGEGPAATTADSDRVQTSLCPPDMKPPAANAGWRAEALYGFCQKVSRMSGKQLFEAVVHNIPRAMFVLLPLLALIMKLLYWRPKRYYVEHLLFLVHNHCFVFLSLLLMILVARIPFIGGLVPWLETAMSLYVIWYLFRAMRVYYGQSRWMTCGKYLLMGNAYLFTSSLVLAGTVLYSAITL